MAEITQTLAEQMMSLERRITGASEALVDYERRLVTVDPEADQVGTAQRIVVKGETYYIKADGTAILNNVRGTDFIKTGWPEVPGVTLSFDNGTRTLTVTDGGSAIYYINGTKYTLGGNKTVVIDDTEGEWFVYFDGATLTASQTPWNITDDNMAFVATLYWDATNNVQILLGYEFHNYAMSAATHNRLHHAGGAAWERGLAVTDALSENVNVSAGGFHDEDIEIDITDGGCGEMWEQVLSPAEMPVFYRDGASAWRIIEAAAKNNADDIAYVDGTDLQYNEFSTPNWVLTNVNNSRYMVMYAVATNDITRPVALIMGQRQDLTLADARNNNTFSEMVLTGLPFQELIVLARLILRESSGGVYYTLQEVTDLRATNVAGNVVSPVISDHGSLAGLGDDDHVQYALLAGRDGGQVVYGSSLTSETLTLAGSSHATPGNVLINPGGGNVVVGANGVDVDFIVNSSVGAGTFTVRGSDGNFGFAKATPEAWHSAYVGVEIGANAALMSKRIEGVSNAICMMQNLYFDGAWKRMSTDEACRYLQINGEHRWYGDASGTADVGFTPTERMRLSVTGVLGIGTTTAAAALSINGGCHVGGDTDPGDNNLAVDGTVGVGTITPDYLVDIWSSDAGAVSTAEAGGLLGIEASDFAYIHFKTSAMGAAGIRFLNTAGDPTPAKIEYMVWPGELLFDAGVNYDFRVATNEVLALDANKLSFASGVDIFLPDNNYLGLGASFGSEDTKIYSNGTHGLIHQTTGNFGVSSEASTPDIFFHVENETAGTDAVVEMIRASHTSAGSATDGFGVAYGHEIENSTCGANYLVSTTEAYWSTEATNVAGWALSLNGNGVTLDGTDRVMTVDESGFARAGAANYRRHYPLQIGALDPTDGATWVDAGAATLAGFEGGAVRMTAHVSDDWDAASDLSVQVTFTVDVDNTGGGAEDEAKMILDVYYKGAGEIVTKAQQVLVDTVVGACARYTQFNASFVINYDEASNVVEKLDVVSMRLSLDTDIGGSDVSPVIINDATFYYNTTHHGIESGDI